MKVTIFDYGAGNLHSIAKALDAAMGMEPRIEPDPVRAAECDLLVLPGVGNFAAATARLAQGREQMAAAITAGVPTLGICLGMQLLFDGSDEGPGDGLGILSGRVRRLQAKRVPHMGWNNGFYYAHSFVCAPEDLSLVRVWASHENDTFPALVQRDNVLGLQFHPEKSGAMGVAYLSLAIEALLEGRVEEAGA